ncbi:MAG: PIN domain-containing protein [Planctomycetes bacterium]|nr:PIN domain-containing protein [Planctomycetota bacterium]
MIVFFDTNVVLDVLFDRKPFSDAAAELFCKVENKQITGYLGSTAITTIHYLARKSKSSKDAEADIRKLLLLFEVAPISKPVLLAALELPFQDYEDAVLHEAAVTVRSEGIVTRNRADFRQSKLPVYSPAELVALLNK